MKPILVTYEQTTMFFACLLVGGLVFSVIFAGYSGSKYGTKRSRGNAMHLAFLCLLISFLAMFTHAVESIGRSGR
jgi:hypothetical protein